MKPFAFVAAIALAVSSVASHSAEPGQLAFNNRCRTCHSVKEGDNRQGPSLHAIIGRKAGSSDGFSAYSQALKTSDIVWDEETLNAFIESPDAVVPGHNMRPYSGLPDAQEREEIVEYLSSATD